MELIPIYNVDEKGWVSARHILQCVQCKYHFEAWVRMEFVISDILIKDTCPFCSGTLKITTFDKEN